MSLGIGLMELMIMLLAGVLAIGFVIVVVIAAKKKGTDQGLNGAMGPNGPMHHPPAGSAPAAAPGPARAPAPQPPLDAAQLPSQWGWCWLDRPGSPRALGFNYVDKTAGASFRLVVENAAANAPAAIGQQAAATNYLGQTIVRLNGHEWVNGTFAAMLPSEPVTRTRVVSLTPDEMQQMALPAVPGWVASYL